MKPTFRPVVYAHHKRKDGTYNVKINVYFNGRERRLPTTIYCTKEDITRTHHIKSQDILNKCNVLIAKMHNAIADISIYDLEGRDVDWLVTRIKNKLQATTFRLDFFEFAETFLQRKKPVTAANYRTALNAFAAYLGGRSIDINDITKSMVINFAEYIENRPKMIYCGKAGRIVTTEKTKKKGLAPSRYVYKLATIFKAAKNKYNDSDADIILIPRSPFENIVIETEQITGEKPISKEDMQLLIADTWAKKNNYRYAIDAMVVSFGLMGVNMADLYEAKPPKNGIFYYNRQKTKDRRPDGAEMMVVVPVELQPYLERLGAGTDKIYWLPNLRKMCKKGDQLSSRVNYHINNWCKKHNVERLKTYGIRKGWATLARATGADKSLTDECIGHTGGYDLTDIYALKPYDKMAELNAKVLAMFQW